MQDDSGAKTAFLNRRDWGSFMSALQAPVVVPRVLDQVYPKVVEAVSSGCAWFSEGAAQASNWLVGGSRTLRSRFIAG